MHKIEFETNYAKTLEAILYVLSKRDIVNMYNVLKAIFSADKFHLNAHGRPVTGDTYIKMTYGAVPSFVLDMINGNPIGLAATGLSAYPFEKSGFNLRALRTPNLDYLSISDIEALDHGVSEYFDLNFTQVMDKNHAEKCWVESDMNRPIDFELIIENEDVLNELKETPLRLVV